MSAPMPTARLEGSIPEGASTERPRGPALLPVCTKSGQEYFTAASVVKEARSVLRSSCGGCCCQWRRRSVGIAVLPAERDAVLIVYADAVASSPISLPQLEPVGGAANPRGAPTRRGRAALHAARIELFSGRLLNERRRPRKLQPNCEHEGGIGTCVPKTLRNLTVL
jgi:hypothetical protein